MEGVEFRLTHDDSEVELNYSSKELTDGFVSYSFPHYLTEHTLSLRILGIGPELEMEVQKSDEDKGSKKETKVLDLNFLGKPIPRDPPF